MMIRNLTSSGPIFFSFPATRSAALIFDSDIAGRFLLRYESGQLTEIIEKRPGKPMRVPVYPADLLGSIYQLAGIDAATQLPHPFGFEAHVLDTEKEGMKSAGMLEEIM